MKKLFLLCAIVLLVCPGIFAEVSPVSQRELFEKSDLVIVGSVVDIIASDEVAKSDFHEYDIPIKYATIVVEQAIKGEASSSICVKYAYDEGLEADVQDPNFEAENRVLLYLTSNNDERDSYSVVYGWSGVCRFYEGKFYHQYFETDFNEYLTNLKSLIQSKELTDTSKDERYFPVAIFNNKEDIDTHRSEWYRKQLISLREPPIYIHKDNDEKQMFRFLWLRTFHHPIAIRLVIDKTKDTGILYVKMTDGAGGYGAGIIKEDFTKEINKKDIEVFLRLLEEEKFWDLPSRDEENTGFDGAQWIIEGVQIGKYHLVDRWTPKEGSIRKIGLSLLELSGLKVKDIY